MVLRYCHSREFILFFYLQFTYSKDYHLWNIHSETVIFVTLPAQVWLTTYMIQTYLRMLPGFLLDRTSSPLSYVEGVNQPVDCFWRRIHFRTVIHQWGDLPIHLFLLSSNERLLMICSHGEVPRLWTQHPSTTNLCCRVLLLHHMVHFSPSTPDRNYESLRDPFDQQPCFATIQSSNYDFKMWLNVRFISLSWNECKLER